MDLGVKEEEWLFLLSGCLTVVGLALLYVNVVRRKRKFACLEFRTPKVISSIRAEELPDGELAIRYIERLCDPPGSYL